MEANKIILNNEVLIDLTEDTAAEDDVLEGKTFHKADGTRAVGTGKGGSSGGDEFPADKYFEGGYAEITLPNATKLKAYAFYNDTTIINVNMPKVTSIGNNAFNSCSNLALTSLPDGVTSIGNDAFYSCSKLALTSLPDGVTYIGNGAFNSCSNLALTSLPDGVTSIGNAAFVNCINLSSITFKGKPSSIASNAFYRSINLTTINVPWAEGAVANAPWGATNATINYNYTGE